MKWVNFLSVILIVTLSGCGMYGSHSYPTEGNHWKPLKPITQEQEKCFASIEGLPTANGSLTDHGMNIPGGSIDGVNRNKDFTEHFIAHALPDGRFITPAFVGNTQWNYRSVVYKGHWLILKDIADAYDPVRKLALFSVMQDRGAR